MRNFCTAICISWIFILTAGCSNPIDKALAEVKEANSSNIQKVTNCYRLCQMLGNRFKSKDDLIKFVKTSPQIESNLKRMGIEPGSFEECFVGKDGQEFFVNYDTRVPRENTQGVPIVFEIIGVDGVREVGFSGGSIKLISSDQEYDQLMKSAK